MERQRPPESRPQRVLVADGYQDAADSLALLLDLWGYEVSVAHTGVEALDLAAAYRHDLAVLEAVLPGRDGYEVGCHLLESGIEVVMLSGLSDGRHRHRCREGGLLHVLVKPVDPEELRVVLQTLSGE